MTVIYVGRYGLLRIHKDDAKNKRYGMYCQIMVVGPTGTLAKGHLRVRVLDRAFWTVRMGCPTDRSDDECEDIEEADFLPLTDGQEDLRQKHGMPHEFAAAVRKAVGEISMDEAEAALRKYLEEFAAA